MRTSKELASVTTLCIFSPKFLNISLQAYSNRVH